MDEYVPLTNADLLVKLRDLEFRLTEANSREMTRMQTQTQEATASKYRTLQNLVEANNREMKRLEKKLQEATGGVVKGVKFAEFAEPSAKRSPTANSTGDKTASRDDDKEKLPQSTASFFLVSKYPLFESSSQRDDDSKTVLNSSSASLSIELGNDPENETGKEAGKEAPKPPCCCPFVDWTSRDALYIPFWFAGITWTLQMSIYFIILANSTDIKSSGPLSSKLKLPIGVDPWTRAAECLAIFITVYSQADFFEGLNLIGNSPQLVKEGKSSLVKCCFAAATQIIAGICGMALTFLLIMQAIDVKDLLLNFTAMEFVANLDGIAFNLAENGYLWLAGEQTAKVVSDTRFERSENRRWLKRWPHLFMLVILWSLWGWTMFRQMSRKYCDNEIVIQFTDAVIPWLGTLSGSYIGTHLPFWEKHIFGKNANLGPVVYENIDQKRYCEQHRLPTCERGMFFYCLDVKEWRFNVAESTTNLNCQDWVLQGIHDEPKLSNRYDILSYSSAKWFARDADMAIALPESLTMIKPFSKEFYKKQEDHNILESSGILFDRPYYYQVVTGSGLQRIHDRPVYASYSDENDGFIAFNGYRWILVKFDNFTCPDDCKGSNVGANSCLNECMMAAFDPFYSSYKAERVSDPMVLQTSGDTWVPSDGLAWFPAKPNEEAKRTQPDIEDKGLPQLIAESFDMLETVNEASPKELRNDPAFIETANKMFAQSSRLSASKSFAQCDVNNGEMLLTVELVTDIFPEETSMLVMEMSEASPLYYLNSATSPVKLALEKALDDGGEGFPSFVRNRIERTVALNESAFFSWDPQTPHFFSHGETHGKIKTYRYGTCLPRNSCAAVLLVDSDGDGLIFPGKFELYLNSKPVVFETNAGYFYRMYQLGPNCESKCYGNCYDEGDDDADGMDDDV